jgi:hypothetical protein
MVFSFLFVGSLSLRERRPIHSLSLRERVRVRVSIREHPHPCPLPEREGVN